MKVDRRNLLIAGGMSLVSSMRGFARSSDAAVPPAQSEKLSSGVARLMEALHANRLPLVMSGEGPAGRDGSGLSNKRRTHNSR